MKSPENMRGQTLVLALVLMVILVVAAFFLFDFQSLIRAKLKVETAAQAGALTAAQWQRESLNLIGELNLVKASTALLTDIPPKVSGLLGANMNGEEQAQVAASEQLVTEMQTRISFVGPLIAWGAAEQAVKNNGINGESRLIARALDRYMTKIANNDDMRYYEPVNGYYWRMPYLSMLQSLRDSAQLAVRPNGIFSGIDHVDPAWLGDEGLYRAIRSRNWCYPTLNRLIKEYPDSFWESQWFQVDLSPARFPEESEIFTLDIEFGRRALRGQTLQSVKDELRRYRLDANNLPDGFVRWAVYGDSWLEEAGGAYTGPDLTVWQGPGGAGGGPYFFLRRDLRPSAVYGGPVAVAEVAQDIPTLSRWQGRGTSDADAFDAAEVYNAGLVREVKTPEVAVGNYSVARPIGALRNTGDLPPVAAQVILPVFADAVLIPGSMLRYRMMPAGGNRLESFLLWLASVNDLFRYREPLPSGTEAYLEALRNLANPAWRRIGWNSGWQWHGGERQAETILSGVGSDQPGWLQAPVIYRGVDTDRYPAGRLTVVRNDDGTVEYHWGNRYFVQRADGSLETNEAIKCFQSPGGPGGVYGINTGPSHR